jgi:hypothetical protein
MDDAAIEQRLHLLQREIDATGSLLKDSKVDLIAAIDALRIEVEILKLYMERFHPSFGKTYPELRQEAIQAIDPEWVDTKLAQEDVI